MGAEMHIAVSVISWTKMEIGKCYGICGPNCKVDIESEKSGLKFRNNYVVVSGSLLAGHVIRLDPSLLENSSRSFRFGGWVGRILPDNRGFQGQKSDVKVNEE